MNVVLHCKFLQVSNLVDTLQDVDTLCKISRFIFYSCCCVVPILPVVSYGCETWSLTLTEEHTCRMRLFNSNGIEDI
jgi:hypothetical protein